MTDTKTSRASLRNLKTLSGYTLAASDGKIGKIEDFLIDDEHWTVRYLVASLHDQDGVTQVLVSPVSFREIDWLNETFHVALTVDQIKHSPRPNEHEPVSRQHERDYYRYYGYRRYWGEAGIWGLGIYPSELASLGNYEYPADSSDAGTHPPEHHLRSASELRGYHIHGTDATIGHVSDFIVDEQTWQVRYLVVDTSNWWFGRKVLIAPHWATKVSWSDMQVHVDLPRQAIKQSPPYNPRSPVYRDYEVRLHDHYSLTGYWSQL